MGKLNQILTLLRIRQYYKNVLIFVGAFFAATIFNINVIVLLLWGFIVLCCTSSISYIINDIIDIEKDKHHEEKLEKKPLASGELSKSFAYLLLIVLIGIIIITLISSILFSIPNLSFMIMVFVLILTGQLYNNFFKNHAFIDIVVLSLLYLWRTLAGCIIINVNISPWLLLAIFELAMFLGIAKRKGDLLHLGEEKATQHKKVYEYYSLSLLDQFQTIIATSVFLTYALYLIVRFNIFAPETVEAPNINDTILILTLPILLYIIMRFMYLTTAKPEMARSTEKVFRDKGILIAGLVFMGILAYIFYVDLLIEFITNLFNP